MVEKSIWKHMWKLKLTSSGWDRQVLLNLAKVRFFFSPKLSWKQQPLNWHKQAQLVHCSLGCSMKLSRITFPHSDTATKISCGRTKGEMLEHNRCVGSLQCKLTPAALPNDPTLHTDSAKAWQSQQMFPYWLDFLIWKLEFQIISFISTKVALKLQKTKDC